MEKYKKKKNTYRQFKYVITYLCQNMLKIVYIWTDGYITLKLNIFNR